MPGDELVLQAVKLGVVDELVKFCRSIKVKQYETYPFYMLEHFPHQYSTSRKVILVNFVLTTKKILRERKSI